jgi:hypothetical protein
MEDYADIYYVDTRNADSRDHRHTSGGSRPAWTSVPPSRTVYVPPGGRPMAPAPAVIYAPPIQQPSLGASLFGKLTAGQVVEMVGQLFAALQPLPAAPNATRSADTDVANLILFNGALAQHAKRDEQVRTLAGLVAKLVG